MKENGGEGESEVAERLTLHKNKSAPGPEGLDTQLTEGAGGPEHDVFVQQA
jgi:hypothetical protein